jgi:hypothetical protein
LVCCLGRVAGGARGNSCAGRWAIASAALRSCWRRTTTALALCGLAWGPLGGARAGARPRLGLNGTSSVRMPRSPLVPTPAWAGYGCTTPRPAPRPSPRWRGLWPTVWAWIDGRNDGRPHLRGRASRCTAPARGRRAPSLPATRPSVTSCKRRRRTRDGARHRLARSPRQLRVAAVATEHRLSAAHREARGPADRRTATSTSAAIAQLVRRRRRSDFDVVAVDVTRRRWPWAYLIVTEVVGRPG